MARRNLSNQFVFTAIWLLSRIRHRVGWWRAPSVLVVGRLAMILDGASIAVARVRCGLRTREQIAAEIGFWIGMRQGNIDSGITRFLLSDAEPP